MMGGSGISWTMHKSYALSSRQITMTALHDSVFTGWMLFMMGSNSIKALKVSDKAIVHNKIYC